MHTLFLCLRYLCKRRLAFFGVAAVALCVALLIVITSLFSGFVDSFLSYSDRIFGQVVLAPAVPMSGYGQLADRLEGLECVRSARPVVQTGGLLYLRPGDVRAVQLLGVDLARQCEERAFREGLLLKGDGGALASFDLSGQAQASARTWLERKLRRAVSDEELPVGVVLGVGVVAEPEELTDEYDRAGILAELASRREGVYITTGRVGDEGDEVSAGASRGAFWPVNVVQTGLHEADAHFVYLPFESVARLVGRVGVDGEVRCMAVVQIAGQPGFETSTVMAAVEAQWRAFATEQLGWSESLIEAVSIYASRDTYRVRMFTGEIRKQLGVLQVMLGLICLVAALLVFVIFFMTVMHKRRDVGIIRSVGGSRGSIGRIFLGYGFAIGVVGAVLGLGLGVLATHYISVIESALTAVLGFKVWKSGVYLFSAIPNEVAWGAVWWIMAAGVAASVLGAFLPAVRAARMHPVQALRYE